MNEPSNRRFADTVRALLVSARPYSLLAGILLYAVGGGIAVYLGTIIDWPGYIIGQAAVTMLQLSSYWLSEYFERVNQPPFDSKTRLRTDADGNPLPAPVPRVVFLQVSVTTLTIGAIMTFLLVVRGDLSPGAFLFLSLAFLLALLYAVPPFRLAYSGYGELVLAVMMANLFPALAFMLQTGDLHRLLAMLTFPLTFLYLAGALARSLQTYASDMKYGRKTMLTRLGWQRGMSLHNILIAVSYLLLSISVLLGLPWRLAYPVFLSMPVALFQIYQMNGIANGAKPRWRMLALTAMATVAFVAYFMNLALWLY